MSNPISDNPELDLKVVKGLIELAEKMLTPVTEKAYGIKQDIRNLMDRKRELENQIDAEAMGHPSDQ